MTQQEKILKHLKIHKEGITTMDAFILYGVTRLSAVMFEIEKRHHIEKKMIPVSNLSGRKTMVMLYRLVEE